MKIDNITPPSPNMKIAGIIPASCPVYILNFKYKSKDKDPFYPIDKVILGAIKDNPDVDLSYLAWLVGFEREIVDSRIDHYLRNEGFLLYTFDGKYKVTDSGERKYLSLDKERPDVEVTGSVMVDGTNLHVWDQMFYENDYFIRFFQGKTNVPHYPIIGLDDPVLQKAVKQLESSMKNQHFSYGLEDDAHSLELIGYDEKYIKDVGVVIWTDGVSKVTKKSYYNDKEVSIQALTPILDNYYFYFDEEGILHQNGGTTTNDNPSTIAVNSSNMNMAVYFANLYKIDNIKLLASNLSNEYCVPRLRVNKNLLKASNNKRLLLADSANRYVKVNAREGGTLIVPIEPGYKVLQYLEFMTDLQKQKDDVSEINKTFVDTEMKKYKWQWSDLREAFIITGSFDELENVDRMLYFKY